MAESNWLIYSLPDSIDFYKAVLIDSGGDRQVVIRPFDGSQITYGIGASEQIDLDRIELEAGGEPSSSEPAGRTSYIQKVESAVGFSEKLAGKVVLSRYDDIPIRSLDASNSLRSLRESYPEAFVYLLHATEHGVWMGASPERLITRKGDFNQTVALAGTKWGDELFGQKEFDEQMMVTQYLMEQLEDTVVEISDVREQAFGSLRHLRTDLSWEDERDLLHFAEKLHPTPAVGGYPKSKAIEFLMQHEGYDRSLYAGYLGLIDPNETSHLFVNLRCIQLFRDRIRVYVGGGINAQSDPESEWEETEKKKEAVLSALKYE